jgi:hypothetical protein
LVYTPQLSAIVTVAHMFVLFRAHIEQRRQVTGESEQEAGRKTQGYFHRVRRMVPKMGRLPPMNSILRCPAYLKAIRANKNADGGRFHEGSYSKRYCCDVRTGR